MHRVERRFVYSLWAGSPVGRLDSVYWILGGGRQRWEYGAIAPQRRADSRVPVSVGIRAEKEPVMNTKEEIELHELEAIERELDTEAPLDAESADRSPIALDRSFLIG
jgi:hypothetical protein